MTGYALASSARYLPLPGIVQKNSSVAGAPSIIRPVVDPCVNCGGLPAEKPFRSHRILHFGSIACVPKVLGSCGRWRPIRAVDDGVIVPGVFGMVLAMVLMETIGKRRT